MKSPKKPRTERVYGTTKGNVTEIGLEVSPDGSSIRFSQEMINTYVETTYPRDNKNPKVITRVPVINADHPFSPDKAIEAFDRLVAVDTGTKIIRGESVSITGVVEGEWNWESGPRGLVRMIRPKVPFCLEFLGVEKDQEQLGWYAALENLMLELRYQESQQVAMIVDSQLDYLASYNYRHKPICLGKYLPAKITMVYGFDKGRNNIPNFLIGLADRLTKQVFEKLEKGDLPWNTSTINSEICKGFRKIPVRTVSPTR